MDAAAPTNAAELAEHDAAPLAEQMDLPVVEEGTPEAESNSEAETTAAGKRARATKVGAKQNAVLAARQRCQKFEVEKAELSAALANDALNAAGKKKLEKVEEKLLKAQEDLKRAQQELYDVELQMQQKQEQEACKRRRSAAASAAGETGGRMSEKGAIKLVEMKLSREAEFANTSDKTDSVWEHLHKDWMALIAKGELPQSDARKKDALISRYSTEIGEFRQFCKRQNAAEQSGASRDDLDNITAHRRPTTETFLAFKYHHRPMSVPVWSINGMTASTGGVGNLLASDDRFADARVDADGDGFDEADDEAMWENALQRAHRRPSRGSGKAVMPVMPDDEAEEAGADEDDGLNFDYICPDTQDYSAEGFLAGQAARDAARKQAAARDETMPPPPPSESSTGDAQGDGGNPPPASSSAASSSASEAAVGAGNGKARASCNAGEVDPHAPGPGPKPLNIGGSGAAKYRPRPKKAVVGGGSMVDAFADFAVTIAEQATKDRKQQADLAAVALSEARHERALRAEEMKAAREDAQAERDTQLSVAKQQIEAASKCSQQ